MKTIKFSFTVKAEPQEVYEVFMDQKKHALVIGDKAKISRKVGGAFSVFDGYATGKNLTLVPNKKIVQSWRASEWPAKHYSTATFEFKATKGGTKFQFTQTGVPDEFAASIKQGWVDYYWNPLKKVLRGK